MSPIKTLLVVAAALGMANAVDLTIDNFEELTAGKTVFLKFYDPMCGQCLKMEPAWEELIGSFRNSKSKLIGSIDCTSEKGRPICDEHGVTGFPTLKFGDVNGDLQEYEGPRDFRSLKKFTEKQLKPSCGIHHPQLCDKATRRLIRRLKEMTLEDLDREIATKQESIQKIDQEEKEYIQQLEETYAEAQRMKKHGFQTIMETEGLKLMKMVAANRGIKIASPPKRGKDEL